MRNKAQHPLHRFHANFGHVGGNHSAHAISAAIANSNLEGSGHHAPGAPETTATIGAANTAITGTSGNDHIIPGANDTMRGAGGNDEFVLGAHSGASVITDFGVSGANASTIDLKHSGIISTSFADLMTHVTEVSGNAVIDLGSGNTLTLDGVDMTTLTAANFELPGNGGQGSEGGCQSGGAGDHHGGRLFNGSWHGPLFAPTVIAGASVAGAGDALTATNSNTIIYAGAGNDTLTAAAGNDVMFAGSGNDVLIGASGNMQMFGGSGNATMTGGSGNDLMVAGSGTTLMTGGAGNNTFQITGGHSPIGNVEITNFSTTGNDRILLADVAGIFGPVHFADLTAHLTQSGANTVIGLDATHNLTLDGTQISALSAADFAFG